MYSELQDDAWVCSHCGETFSDEYDADKCCKVKLEDEPYRLYAIMTDDGAVIVTGKDAFFAFQKFLKLGFQVIFEDIYQYKM